MAAVGWVATVDNYLGRVTKRTLRRRGAKASRRSHRASQEGRDATEAKTFEGSGYCLNFYARPAVPSPRQLPMWRKQQS
jgi:hypothetical protein